jgi:hypothetical protein
MSDATMHRSTKVGKLRPSQVVSMHGPGAVVDLPELSVIVAGIGSWFKTAADRITEPRLEAFIGSRGLYRAPKPGPGRFGGIPAFIFPEYLVCPHPKCRKLARFGDFSFVEYAGEFQCNSPEHQGPGRKPTVFPARFMVACARGHLDDFPWHGWAHGGSSTCTGDLKLIDTGSSGSANDLIVKCSCDASRPLGDAFQQGAHASCAGRQPWIGRSHRDERHCPEKPRTILRGASNAYFPVVASAISIPPWSDPIYQDLAPYLEQLATADSLDKLKQGIDFGFYEIDNLLTKYTVEQIWNALSQRDAPPQETDLRSREYQALLHPEQSIDQKAEFEAASRSTPKGMSLHLSNVIAVTRLREVRALRAFTRIDSIPDVGERHDVSDVELRLAPIGTNSETWRPATELRGEGIFLKFDTDLLTTWEDSPAVVTRGQHLRPEFEGWWQHRGEVRFPGMRYVLLHSFAHVLMREMSLDAGYSSSALRERIYSSREEDMAGLLIYTASSDSDGSLGGLVDLANPDRLGQIIQRALKSAGFCASDPLCSGGRSSHTQLNGAACHACLLVAETSCEMGNKLLDRGAVVKTLAEDKLAFFDAG